MLLAICKVTKKKNTYSKSNRSQREANGSGRPSEVTFPSCCALSLEFHFYNFTESPVKMMLQSPLYFCREVEEATQSNPRISAKSVNHPTVLVLHSDLGLFVVCSSERVSDGQESRGQEMSAHSAVPLLRPTSARQNADRGKVRERTACLLSVRLKMILWLKAVWDKLSGINISIYVFKTPQGKRHKLCAAVEEKCQTV